MVNLKELFIDKIVIDLNIIVEIKDVEKGEGLLRIFSYR